MTSLEDTTTLHNGVKMPWLGFGVWQITNGGEVTQAITTALNTGYRSIDTAAAYGNEDGIGKALQNVGIPRRHLFITTKVWNADQGYESTLTAFNTSLKKLQLQYLDLYLIHWPVDGYLDTWRALETLYREGRVRAIGVANFQPEHLTNVMQHGHIKPMVNQIEFHPYFTQERLVEFCRENNIQVEAWSPLFRGGDLLTNPVVQDIAAQHQKSPAQVILRWDLEQKVVTIPKSVHPERIEENANIFGFHLTEEDITRLTALNKGEKVFEYDPYHVTF